MCFCTLQLPEKMRILGLHYTLCATDLYKLFGPEVVITNIAYNHIRVNISSNLSQNCPTFVDSIYCNLRVLYFRSILIFSIVNGLYFCKHSDLTFPENDSYCYQCKMIRYEGTLDKEKLKTLKNK